MTASSSTTWESRIVGHGLERPDALLANPNNWRIHSQRQQEALGQVLDKVGWVQGVIVNTMTGHVVDGHLRVALALSRGEPEVPVDYVELSEEEERLVLATLDPIAELAVTDQAQLLALFSGLDVDGELEAMIRETAGARGASTAGVTTEDVAKAEDKLTSSLADRQARAPGQVFIRCPHCNEEFGVDRDELDE